MEGFALSSRVEAMAADILRAAPPPVAREGQRRYARAHLVGVVCAGAAGVALVGAGGLVVLQTRLWGAPWFADSIGLAGLALVAWWGAARSWRAKAALRPLAQQQAARLEALAREVQWVQQVLAEWRSEGRTVRYGNLARIERVVQSLRTIQTTLADLRPASAAPECVAGQVPG